VPSLLIQPYVENAIIHGLKTKSSKGYLQIIAQQKDGHLQCIIEDDGIGRERSEELNRKKKIYHKSAGLQITKKRIEIMQKGVDEAETADIRIVDLEKIDAERTGTRVEITIPLKYS
jgi:sensor histidine kinase YesM